MPTRYALALLTLFAGASVQGQSYCEPSFANGCSNWRNLAITIGGLNWSAGGDACTTSDYVVQSATVDAGQLSLMEVTNGVWCGCAVWVDLDNSQSFEAEENLFFAYQGADPSQTYSFMLDIPGDVPTGAYRMRVIAPWGSDGFTPGGTNGSGPCGSYQYGNFTDLTLNILASTGMADREAPVLLVAPNPGTGPVTLSAAHAVEQIAVIGADGRIVYQASISPGQSPQLDLSHVPDGLYILHGRTADGLLRARWVKQ
jgi:hypothetical protein